MVLVSFGHRASRRRLFLKEDPGAMLPSMVAITLQRIQFILLAVFIITFAGGCSGIDAGGNGESDFSSISCWGDSKTFGNHGNITSSYPDILASFLSKEGYRNIVYNLGVNGEKSTEILQRQGGLPLVVNNGFVIPPSCFDSVLISINGRLRNPDNGCNPCEIMGIKGLIIKDYDDKSGNTLYFRRLEMGGRFLCRQALRLLRMQC